MEYESWYSEFTNSKLPRDEKELKEINTLTKYEEFLFYFIYKLPNDEEKKVYLQKSKSFLKKPLPSTIVKPQATSYNFKDILDRFSSKKG